MPMQTRTKSTKSSNWTRQLEAGVFVLFFLFPAQAFGPCVAFGAVYPRARCINAWSLILILMMVLRGFESEIDIVIEMKVSVSHVARKAGCKAQEIPQSLLQALMTGLCHSG